MSTAEPEFPLVEREGPIFRFGHHPKKSFSLSAEEYRQVYPDGAEFPPWSVPLNLYHRDDPQLKGRLGYIASTEARGDMLWAKVLMAQPLHDLYRGQEMKVSGEFHPVTKRFLGLAIDPNPFIPEAVLMSALVEFSKTKQTDPPDDDDMDDPYAHIQDEGMRRMQMHHDITAEHNPGLCESHRPVNFCATPAREKGMAGIHDLAVEHGATCPGRTARFSQGEPPMPEIEEEEVVESVNFSDSDEYKQMQAQIDRLRRENVRKDAEAFADSVRDRILPHERKNLIVAFSRAAEDDEANPEKVTFSADGKDREGGRLDVLKDLFTKRPKHNLTDPKVKTVLLSHDADGEDAEAEQQAREERRKQNQMYAS